MGNHISNTILTWTNSKQHQRHYEHKTFYRVHYGVDAVSRFEFERIELAITLQLANQPVALESETARDQCQSAAVTPRDALFSDLNTNPTRLQTQTVTPAPN